jgi:hypothetical protein
MATRNRIGRLTERIEALAERRWGRLTLEELTEEGWAKLRKLAAENPSQGRPARPASPSQSPS